MSISKVLLIFNFILLLFWWLILKLLHIETGLGGMFFNLGFGAYTLFLPLLIIYNLVISEKNINNNFVLFASIGMVFFGLGTLFWFYYDFAFIEITPFPTMSDLFYLLQFPFTALALIMLVDRESSLKHQILKTAVFVLAVFSISYEFAKIYLASSSIEGFLEIYYPVESFALLVLVSFSLAKLKLSHSGISSSFIAYLIIGQVLWLVGDCLFFYTAVTSQLSALIMPDIFYLLGSFFLMYGVLSAVERANVSSYLSSNEAVYYQKVSYYKPISLN